MNVKPITLAGVALEEVCPVCGGRGQLDDPRWREWRERGQPLGDEPRDGLGRIAPHEVSCQECGGRGVRPTEAGQQLLRFVERWGEQPE